MDWGGGGITLERKAKWMGDEREEFNCVCLLKHIHFMCVSAFIVYSVSLICVVGALCM